MDSVIGRDRELLAIDGVLDGLDDGPALLAFEGEPGIGKTTLMRVAVQRAQHKGLRVLSCAGAVSESRLSYVALADLFAEVGGGVLADLPPAQRIALDAALLRAGSAEARADPSAVATAGLSVIERLARDRPVVVAIDDLQWLDRSSAHVIEFCAPRLSGRVALIVSQRAGGDGGTLPRLAPSGQAMFKRVPPLDSAALGELLRQRAEWPLSRRVLARISETSGGNPLYALELLRALPPGEAPTGPLVLPPTLQDVVTARLEGLGPDVEELLLAIAALADPTLDLLTEALGAEAPALLEQAEAQGVVERRGTRVRFSHPLLAEGTLARAPATRRRAMHRRLSEAVTDVEDRARHLALAAMVPDALPALDEAARHTRGRGAPVAAAELLELAVELGGDSSHKRRAAEHHLDAGNVPRAQVLLEEAVAELPRGDERAGALVLLAELRTHGDSFLEARVLLDQARREAAPGSPLQVVAGLQLTFILYNLGQRVEAGAVAHEALELAEGVASPGLLAQALGVVATVDFANGSGVDEERLARALALEDPDLRTSNEFRPTLTASMVIGFAGRLDDAVELMTSLYREFAERGEEHGLAWLGSRLVWLECWRGNLDAAEHWVAESEHRLLALDTPVGRMLALTARAQADAYAGRVEAARRVAEEALALAEETDWKGAIAWQLMTLGFLDLSVGHTAAAAERLAPFAVAAVESGLPEPSADGVLVHGDAAEALILVGRVQEAEQLVTLLEQRGAALDRPWAVAVGARCRGLILASQGDVEAAAASLRRALVAHDLLPMPIEHARTLLTLGRVERRLGERKAAEGTLALALDILERVGSPRWADQVRSEQAALGMRAGPSDTLTPSEERVARLAGSGLTNRQIASALQISPKTVESHLGRVYRKLAIRSRAELGALVAGGGLVDPP
ncbi:MAG TPA: AAA family ATPase [Thermoleophilaceae bacterium]